MRTPDDSKRHTIIGRTGSGKTQAAIHALSLRSYDIRPWIVINYKGDDLINSIPHAKFIDTTELPKAKHHGIFVVQPAPDDYEGIESMLTKIWAQGETGIYVDEGLMLQANPISGNPPFRRILTQGRSLHIPVILSTQRASHLDRFVFTESEFFQVFDLSDERELGNIKPFIKGNVNMETLPEYHSFYYDVGARKNDPHKLVILKPVPGREAILQTFDARQPSRRKFRLI
jgi:hypothetical protein